MRQLEHLQQFQMTLTALSPVFIGSGDRYQEDEYLFDPVRKMVSFVHKERFFRFLLEHDLIDRYEEFALFEKRKDLRKFLKSRCGVSDAQIRSFTGRPVSAADAIDDMHSFKEIQAFTRLPDGRAYVPGSSVKGCLRTVLLTDLLLRDDGLNRNSIRDGQAVKQLEHTYLNVLHCSKKPNDMANSIMRGISISDSAPIDENDMALCAKIDLFPNGEKSKVPVIRQCAAPDTVMKFCVTLDQSVLRDRLTVSDILAAIRNFDRFYQKTFHTKFFHSYAFDFPEPFVVLGGGSGYFGKNLVYPFYHDEHQKAVQEVSRILSRRFPRHGHQKDPSIGISPHTEKLTRYDKLDYAFGFCKVELS